MAELLRDAGHDALHTLEVGLEAAEDDVLLRRALDEGRVVVSGDTDFGALLAPTNQRQPSVILLRGRHYRTANDQADLIITHFENLRPDLEAGAIIVITDETRPHPATSDPSLG